MVLKKGIAYLSILGVLAGAANTGCSHYKGRSLDEVVDLVKTPREAQRFINRHIDYAHEDMEGDDSNRNRPRNPNMDLQSFRTTFERGRGVCRDGAVAVAAMVQDDGYESYYLDLPGINHAVYAFRTETGWGSAGINESDYFPPTKDSVEDLARAITSRFGKDEDYEGFTLYELAYMDLVDGVDNGMLGAMFFVKSESESRSSEYSLQRTDYGYVQDETRRYPDGRVEHRQIRWSHNFRLITYYKIE